MAKLVLVRHGKSEWNDLGLWTGWKDIPLHEDGIEDARRAGESIQDITFDQAFTSKLIRAQDTLRIIKDTIKQTDLPTIQAAELNERDYGVYTGKNKWDLKAELGEEMFKKIRRGWDQPIPDGESLKQVYERVIPYYQEQIFPLLKENKNVLISAHGNSLRALVKFLENLSEEEIAELEFGIGEVYIYDVDQSGTLTHKEIRAKNASKGNI